MELQAAAFLRASVAPAAGRGAASVSSGGVSSGGVWLGGCNSIGCCCYPVVPLWLIRRLAAAILAPGATTSSSIRFCRTPIPY